MSPADTSITVHDSHVDIVNRAAKKLNMVMLPFVFIFSVISSIDRANIAFAAVDMNSELGFTAETYGLGAAIFFVSYSVFQIPSNVLLLFVGGPTMLGGIAVSWGLIASSMAAVSNRTGFLVVRFLLGIAEAGTVPGIWAYLSHLYPSNHLTLPTTFYMAGITAAQALGAPLAAALLDGVRGMPGWRWLFLIEGIPAILMGLAILIFLPRSLAQCCLLTAEERQHMQVEIDKPELAAAAAAAACTVTTDDKHGSGDAVKAPCKIAGSTKTAAVTSASSSSSSCSTLSSSATCSTPSVPACSNGGCLGLVFAPAEAGPQAAHVAADLVAALRCPVVWCASAWRFLYLITLNGLIFFVPLLVHELLDNQGASNSSSHKNVTRASSSTMMLTAVPYLAGVLTHIANGCHSRHVGERRFHIAVPWVLGGVILCALPAAWMHDKDVVAFVLLALACMGVMGCDGVDVSWIISLFQQLTASQRVLAMAVVNMVANFGSFVGPYLNGFLKTSTGHYYAACWMMGSMILLAAVFVAVFPMRLATGVTTGGSGFKAGGGNHCARQLQQQQQPKSAGACQSSRNNCAAAGSHQQAATTGVTDDLEAQGHATL